MSESKNAPQNEIESTERRGFIAAAIGAGVALTAGSALAADKPVVRADAAKAAVAANAALSAEDAAKTLKITEAIKAQVGDDVVIEWVKGHVPGTRRVVQLKG